jgi:hypothetical protein
MMFMDDNNVWDEKFGWIITYGKYGWMIMNGKMDGKWMEKSLKIDEND